MPRYVARKLGHTLHVVLGVVTLAFATLYGWLFQEVIVYGAAKHLTFKPRSDYRLLVSEMTVTP